MSEQNTGHCINTCTQGEGKGDQIRCVFCARWFHISCVNLPKSESEGMWPCHICRQLPYKIDNLQKTVDLLLTMQRETNERVTENNLRIINIESQTMITDKVVSAVKDLADELKEKVSEVKDLANEVKEGVKGISAQALSTETVRQKKDLWISDSTIRDVKAISSDLEIMPMNGKYIMDVRKSLIDSEEKYNTIYLGPGSNNCSSGSPVDKIVEEYQQLVTTAKEYADQIVISSILPRSDTETVDAKVMQVNTEISKLAEEQGVTYINNDLNFRYRNGQHDEDLLKIDNIHLSEKGVKRLIKNVGLSSRAQCKTTAATWQKQKIKNKEKAMKGKTLLFKQSDHELSNFYPCDLYIFDQEFRSSEAAYQYAKAMDHSKHDIADEIMAAPSAAAAKEISKQIKTSPAWHKKKNDTMKEILEAKLYQCDAFRSRLSMSGTLSLVEDTSDDYWGRGNDGSGKNMMGVLLEKLRDTITAKQPVSHPNRQRPPKQRTYDRRRTPAEDVACWYCGENNHVSDSCRHQKLLYCNICNQPGHKAKHHSEETQY